MLHCACQEESLCLEIGVVTADAALQRNCQTPRDATHLRAAIATKNGDGHLQSAADAPATKFSLGHPARKEVLGKKRENVAFHGRYCNNNTLS